MLFHNYQMEDILIFLEETLSSRHRTEEEPNFGTSTRDQEPSNPETTTNHGTSNPQEDQPTCKSGAPTHNGGKYLSLTEPSSLT